MQGAELRAQQPIEKGPVLQLDRPWEGAFSGYFTVIQEPDDFGSTTDVCPGANGDGNAAESTCYAESADGIRWTKPDLGLFEVAERARITSSWRLQPPFSHNFTPFLDTRPGVPADERYKALAGTSKSGLAPFASADGIHWRQMREATGAPSIADDNVRLSECRILVDGRKRVCVLLPRLQEVRLRRSPVGCADNE